MLKIHNAMRMVSWSLNQDYNNNFLLAVYCLHGFDVFHIPSLSEHTKGDEALDKGGNGP